MTYQEKKEQIRNEIIKSMYKLVEVYCYFPEFKECQLYFEKKARRFGLLKELREEGILWSEKNENL